MKLKCKKCGNEEYFYEKARFAGDHHVIMKMMMKIAGLQTYQIL